MIYTWCTRCSSRQCALEDSHRAQGLIRYRADFTLGGRYRKRIRKLFALKKDAVAYEYVTLADFKRGTFLPADDSKTSFDEFFKLYEERKIRRYMKGADEEVYRLRTFKEMFAHRPMQTFKLEDWERYLSGRVDTVTQSTLNRTLTALKTMFKWAVDNKYLRENPLKEAGRFKVDNIRVRWLDTKEIDDILTACTEAKDLDLRDILVVALNTGFRKANLEQVTAHDINNGRIAAVKTKSGKAYEVPICQTLGTLLNWLVAVHPSGPLLNFKNFRRRFDAIVQDPTVTLHTFRHTFASQCLKKGVPIDRVCAWLGHHSMEFTRSRYGHLCPSQEAVEIQLLNLGGNFNDRKARNPDNATEVL